MNLKPEEFLPALELSQRKVKPEGQSPIERLAETGNKAENYIESADGMIKDMKVIEAQLSKGVKETNTSLEAGTNQPQIIKDTTELTKAIKEELGGQRAATRTTEEEMDR